MKKARSERVYTDMLTCKKHYAEQKKPNTKEHRLYDPIYIKF